MGRAECEIIIHSYGMVGKAAQSFWDQMKSHKATVVGPWRLAQHKHKRLVIHCVGNEFKVLNISVPDHVI